MTSPSTSIVTLGGTNPTTGVGGKRHPTLRDGVVSAPERRCSARSRSARARESAPIPSSPRTCRRRQTVVGIPAQAGAARRDPLQPRLHSLRNAMRRGRRPCPRPHRRARERDRGAAQGGGELESRLPAAAEGQERLSVIAPFPAPWDRRPIATFRPHRIDANPRPLRADGRRRPLAGLCASHRSRRRHLRGLSPPHRAARKCASKNAPRFG